MVSETVVLLVGGSRIFNILIRGGACKTFEDDAATHRDNLRGTPFARRLAVRDWEKGRGVHDVQSCKHWDNVAVVDAVWRVMLVYLCEKKHICYYDFSTVPNAAGLQRQ